MKRYLPVALDLAAQRVLLIGGGAVAAARLPELLACGAEVIVITPEASPAIHAAAAAGEVALISRRFRAGDTEGCFLVLAATDDPEANAAAYAEATAAGRLVNVCDDPAHCNVIFASQVRRGPLTVSIFTHGTSPALSKRLRQELEAFLGPEWGDLAELLAEVRPSVLARADLTPEARRRLFEAILDSEALEAFREGRPAAAREIVQRILGG